MSNLEQEVDLQKGIHPWMANLIALGGIIGSCYFIGSGWLIQEMGVSAAFAFIFGGALVFIVMQSFAELLVNIPRRGSFVSYSREFISPIWAIGTGWSYWFNWVCYIPAEALAAGIIMNELFGEIGFLTFGGTNYTGFTWAVIFLIIITVINLKHVEGFGYIESILALLKIFAIVVFVIVAFLLVIGVIGSEPIGFSIGFPDGNLSYETLFPAGWFPLLSYLVIILVNFQGTEIIGLAAAETRDPETTIPKACRQVAYRIVAIYVIPIILLVLVISRNDSGLDGSMFAAALDNWGTALNMPWLKWIAAGFAVIVLTAAFSCANSGFFGTVRSLYALAVEGLAPKKFAKLNKSGVPSNATYFTLALCWVVLIINIFFGETNAFAVLISVSGFTGTICWMSICLSQVVFRKRVLARGYALSDLKSKAPMAPFLPLFCLCMMTMGLGLMTVSGDPILFWAFFAALAALCLPMAIYYGAYKAGKVQLTQDLPAGEKTFDELFPVRK